MGSIIRATCECGYETKDLFFGAGVADFEKACIVPALKNSSSHIEMKNYKMKHLLPDYIFYNDNLLSGVNNSSRTIDFYPIKIFQENNLCPKCKNYSLSFIDIGCFY